MKRFIDLSQPISYKHTIPHPALPKPLILPFQQHGDPGHKFSSQSEIIIISNHAGTHVDALKHFDPDPKALDIAQMPLETFSGEAVCIDMRSIPGDHYMELQEFVKILNESPIEIRKNDIVLFCTDHYNITKDEPSKYPHGYAGIAPEVIRWMASNGVKLFGMETISCDIPDITDEYPSHVACKEVKLAHIENMCNLKEVVNKRFDFHAFPLKLEDASASPIRAVAIL